MNDRKKQINRIRGVALISVMVAVAILSSIVLFIAYDQEIDISRTARILEKQQAIMYVLGMEEWAKNLLNQDSADNDEDKETDGQTDVWYNEEKLFTLDGIKLSGRIEALQSKYNINNIALHWPPGEKNKDNLTPEKQQALEQEETYLTNLLKTLKIDKNTIDALLDWLDPDDKPRGNTDTESNYYQNKDLPYKTANYILASLDELKVIKGFDEGDLQAFEQLKNYLTVLPVKTAINVNLVDAKVLLTLDSRLTTALADQIIDARDGKPNKVFDKVEEFNSEVKSVIPQNGGQTGQPEERIQYQHLSVTNDFFALITTLTFGDTEYRVRSLIERVERGDLRVIQREFIP